MHSFLGAPLEVGGKLFGTLVFTSQRPHERPFSQAEQRFLHLMAQWIGLEMEREQYLVQLQHNATEISDKNRELAIARDEALEVSRLKTEFLATMSHEIRTPMNAIMGMTELLLESTLDVEQREYAETARDSARLLLSLLNNVLDFSKFEAGKLVLEQIVFDPQKVLDDAVAMFGLQAQQKKIQLNSFVSPKIPNRLRGDPIRFSQVVINLVANAIKFTNHGHVTVWSELVTETSRAVEIMVQVRDTGIGLTDAAKAKIFQPFTQADGSTTRRFGGSGLGLAIAKRLVDRMGGVIGLESVEGEGSTFWFTAKFLRANGEHVDGFKQGKVIGADEYFLVYEGLEEARNLWRRYLSDWNIPFDFVDTPQGLVDCLETAKKRHRQYTCCIIDMEGIQDAGELLYSQLVHLTNTNQIKVIMISGCEKRAPNQTHLQFDLLRGRLVRPFSRSVVEKLLANVLHESLERKSAIPVEPPEIQSTNSTESLTNKLIMVAEDNPANQQLAMVQLKRLGYRVITVSTGAQAVDELAHRYEDYALVLMDVQMPEMDGYQAARLIRKGEAASGGHIPIVAMTANVLHDDRQACLEAGMDAYVPKPVLLEDLRKVIAHCLQGGEMPRIAEPRLADLISETVQLDERILADLRSLNQPDKPDFFEQLVGLYLDDSKSLMDTIHAAAEGKDSESLRKAIHSMKGISSNLGAARLSQLCWQVENSIRNNLPLDQDWLTLFENEYASTCDALKRSVLQSNQ
jgi:signal transduction histidine kinase/CheY-like chemotaxis protein